MSDLRWALAPYPCWKCGSSGHFAQDCPRYIAPERLAEKRAALREHTAEEHPAG